MNAETTPVGTIAVLGLGTMGRAFAANLAAAGYTVRGYNRSEAGREGLDNERLSTFASPVEAVQGADVVLMMLSDAAVTTAVLGDVVGSLASDTVVVQMATIGVKGTDEVIRLVAQRSDVHLIDAPVSGTRGPAIAGTVTVLASGADDASRLRVEPVFEVIGGRTLWLGEVGAGTRMKLVLNAWLVSVMNGIAEAAEIAQLFGIGYDELAATLEGGPLASSYAAAKLKKMATGDYEPEMALKWASKDARLAIEAYRLAGGGELPGLERIDERWMALIAKGMGELDLAVVHAELS